jgi:hypothetical protein
MTVFITTPAGQAPKGSASANLDISSRRRGGAGKKRQAYGAMSSLQRRLPEWLLLEGPRKFAINGLVIIASMLGAGVILKDALKQVAVIETISLGFLAALASAAPIIALSAEATASAW